MTKGCFNTSVLASLYFALLWRIKQLTFQTLKTKLAVLLFIGGLRNANVNRQKAKCYTVHQSRPSPPPPPSLV